MIKKTVKIFLLILGAVAIYFAAGIMMSSFVFPPAPIEHSDYFQPGDHLVSNFEGFDQTILSINDGWLHARLEARPGAVGPPEHFHEAFTETFTVKTGTLSILVNGEKRTLRAGETLSIPPMTRHKPFNETNGTVIIESDSPQTLPVEFGYLLSQLYGFMDGFPNGPNTFQTLMQLSVYGSMADSYIADGPPLGVQKAMRVVMEPTARLLGYKNYYEEYKPKR